VGEGGFIPGLDVSRWQGVIDWPAVAEAGYKFVFIKATEGTAYIDPRLAANWKGAREAGLKVGAYHFFWPSLAAQKQAQHFLTALGDMKLDLPLALDVGKPGKGDIGGAVKTCLYLIEEWDARKPLLYTAKFIWDENVAQDFGWERWPLWVANYGVRAPALPEGWDTWLFWQYTNMGLVPGIQGRVDLDWFAGSLDQLEELDEGEVRGKRYLPQKPLPGMEKG